MRITVLSALLSSLAISLFSPTYAQAEYYTNGERITALGGTFQRNTEGNTWGSVFEGFLSEGVSIELGYSSYALRNMDAGEGRISTLALGFNGYPSRQGAGKPITMAVGLNVSMLSGDITGRRDTEGGVVLGVGLGISHAIMSEGYPIRVAPSLTGISTLLLHEKEGGLTSHGVFLGLGLGAAITSHAMLFAEPNMVVTFSQGESVASYGFTFGFSMVR